MARYTKEEYRKIRREKDAELVKKFPTRYNTIYETYRKLIDKYGPKQVYLMEFFEFVEAAYKNGVNPVELTVAVHGSAGTACFREAKRGWYNIGKYADLVPEFRSIVQELASDCWED